MDEPRLSPSRPIPNLQLRDKVSSAAQRWLYSPYSLAPQRALLDTAPLSAQLCCTADSLSLLSYNCRDYFLEGKTLGMRILVLDLRVRAACATLNCYTQDTRRSPSTIEEIKYLHPRNLTLLRAIRPTKQLTPARGANF